MAQNIHFRLSSELENHTPVFTVTRPGVSRVFGLFLSKRPSQVWTAPHRDPSLVVHDSDCDPVRVGPPWRKHRDRLGRAWRFRSSEFSSTSVARRHLAPRQRSRARSRLPFACRLSSFACQCRSPSPKDATLCPRPFVTVPVDSSPGRPAGRFSARSGLSSLY
jgi:hypothetical protein